MTRKQPDQQDDNPELDALRQRIDALEQTNAALQAEITRMQVAKHGTQQGQVDECRFFERLVTHSSEGMLAFDTAGSIFYANAALEALIGEPLPGKQLLDYLDEGEQERMQQEVLPTLEAQSHWQGMLHYQRCDGVSLPTLSSFFVLWNAAGETVAQAAIIHDIREQMQREESLLPFRAVIEHTPDCVAITDSSGSITYSNAAFDAMNAFGAGLVRRFIRVTLDEGSTQQVQKDVKWQGILNFRRRDGSTFTGLLSAFLIPDSAHTTHAAAGIVRDVTEQVQAEKEQAALEVALQEQLIQAQQATIRELSTPIIPVADDVIVMPLVGAIDSARARQIVDTLLAGIAAHRARIAILDTTGVKVMDQHVANALVYTARAANLLGTEVMLTGIGPSLAQILVELDAQPRGIATYNTLQNGIQAALQKRR
jgi:PAS domain S-box-containing protein